MKVLRSLALAGNVVYILWIVYNAIDEGFQGVTNVEAVVLLGLVILLILNIVLLVRQKPQ